MLSHFGKTNRRKYLGLFSVTSFLGGRRAAAKVVQFLTATDSIEGFELIWGHTFQTAALEGMALVVAPTLWLLATAPRRSAAPVQE